MRALVWWGRVRRRGGHATTTLATWHGGGRSPKLAQGADVLVHSAVYLPAIDRLVARVPNAPGLKQSIIAHQTSAEDAGRVAEAAGVKLLVLSHLVPPDDPEVTERMWIDAASAYFKGKVIVGHDLQEI